MNILVSGILGYMGREVVKLCEAGCRGAVCVGVSCESAGVAIVAGLDHGIETVGVQLVDGVSR